MWQLLACELHIASEPSERTANTITRAERLALNPRAANLGALVRARGLRAHEGCPCAARGERDDVTATREGWIAARRWLRQRRSLGILPRLTPRGRGYPATHS